MTNRAIAITPASNWETVVPTSKMPAVVSTNLIFQNQRELIAKGDRYIENVTLLRRNRHTFSGGHFTASKTPSVLFAFFLRFSSPELAK